MNPNPTANSPSGQPPTLSERRGVLRHTEGAASVTTGMTPPTAPAIAPLSVPPSESAARR